MRPVGALLGIISVAIGISLLVAGVALIVVFGPGQDEDGYVHSPTYRLASSGYALTSDRLDLAPYPGDWFPANVATVRLDVESSDGQEIFVGIGPSADVARYLDEVAHDRIDHLGWAVDDVRYDRFDGGAPATVPGDQGFWVAEGTSEDRQTLDWDVERGDWTIVVMNADGSGDIDISTEFGVSIPILPWIGGGLAVVGLVVSVIGIVFLRYGLGSRRRA